MESFRKIRQGQLKKGSMKRYLSFAIGEILLVMLGLLLAFQIDNWKEEKHEIYTRELDEIVGIIELIDEEINAEEANP